MSGIILQSPNRPNTPVTDFGTSSDRGCFSLIERIRRCVQCIWAEVTMFLRRLFCISEPQQVLRIAPRSAEENIATYRETCEMAREFPAPVATIVPSCPITTTTRRYRTHIHVENATTLQMAQRLTAQGYNPLVLDMANRYGVGGGVELGHNAQEEILCYQSNLMVGLEQIRDRYPLPELGGALIRGVTFFRDDPQNGYRSLAQPFQADVFASAAYDQRPGSDCPADPSIYNRNTQEKIRIMFRAAIQNGNDSLVLGAFGCGAFRNVPAVIAGFYDAVLKEPEFAGKFKEVVFAIVDDHNGTNYRAFKDNIQGVSLVGWLLRCLSYSD